MKTTLLIALALTSFAMAQPPEKMISVPESKLTEQQKAELLSDKTQSWVGIGKEIGEAVNSSMAAITTQSNNFAQTPVGKLTAFIVIWKVIGDQAIHLFGGMLEFIVFVPIWLWSYRKMCMNRKIVTSREGLFGKRTYQVVPYNSDSEFTPRHGHCIVLVAGVATMLITVFSY